MYGWLILGGAGLAFYEYEQGAFDNLLAHRVTASTPPTNGNPWDTFRNLFTGGGQANTANGQNSDAGLSAALAAAAKAAAGLAADAGKWWGTQNPQTPSVDEGFNPDDPSLLGYGDRSDDSGFGDYSAPPLVSADGSAPDTGWAEWDDSGMGGAVDTDSGDYTV